MASYCEHCEDEIPLAFDDNGDECRFCSMYCYEAAELEKIENAQEEDENNE